MLVYFHRPAVRVLDDDPASPRHSLVLLDERSTKLPQRLRHIIERSDIKARKRVAARPSLWRTARSTCRIDRKVHRTQLDSQMHRAVVVQFLFQLKADRTIKAASVHDISREQNKRCHLGHGVHYGTRDARSPAPSRVPPVSASAGCGSREEVQVPRRYYQYLDQLDSYRSIFG
jgi:hypothetical protein